MKKINLDIIVNSEKECIKLGKKISKYLTRGDILALNGELGSGKTTFVKGVLSGLKYNKEVTSPTFTLVNEYDSKYKVIHIDFYREKNIDRWIDLGIYEYFDSENIVIIEWPTLIPNIVPLSSIKINFEHIDINKRRIYIK